MGDETIVKDEAKIIKTITLSNGKSYKMMDVRYKDIKKAMKIAGDDKNRLNDALMQAFFPEMTQEFIDDLKIKDLKIISDAIREESGMDLEKVEGF